MDIAAALAAFFGSENYHLIYTAISQAMQLITTSSVLAALLPKELKTGIRALDEVLKLLRLVLDTLAANYGHAKNEQVGPPAPKVKK